MLYACFAPKEWMDVKQNPPVQTEDLDQVLELNAKGYNAYFHPNHPSIIPSGWVESADVDVFEWVFVDMDLKEGIHTKESFIDLLLHTLPFPTKIIDTGNGIHAYWRITDLDAMSFLRLSRRLMRLYKTDDAVQKLKQVMRLPGTLNTKDEHDWKPCKEILSDDGETSYTCEQLDKLLPPITLEDEEYCKAHYNKAYAVPSDIKVDDSLPPKFGKLIKESKEVERIFKGDTEDRSKSDMRLGHILFANGFTREEAMSVLVNVPKALSRAPVHRVGYAENIVDKIWTFETKPEFKGLSKSVRDILSAPPDVVEGIRFPCWDWLDDFNDGHKLGDVVGLIAGVGVGKTSVALNMFLGYVRLNPSYVHMFFSLEQPIEEIARRWRRMCGSDTSLYDKVHIAGNYNDDGSFRNLSLGEIKDYIIEFQKQTNKKVGCVVVDHIGILKMKDENGENQRIIDICHQLKPFALETKTLFVIQSQVNRDKAGIGDLEVNKDGAYGTMFFESYVDYLVAIWQPLKRMHSEGAPLATAYKFCKVRSKHAILDTIKEDVRYKLIFDPDTEHFRKLTQEEEKSFSHFLKICTEKRKQDRKTELVEYVSLGGADESTG